jgi:serine protease Do
LEDFQMDTRRKTVSILSATTLALVGAAALGLEVGRAQVAQAAHSAAAEPSARTTEAPTERAPLTRDTFRDVARRETAGVVNVSTTKVVKRSEMEDPFQLFGDPSQFFFGRPGRRSVPDEPREQKRTETSLGSGFVVDKDGYILTNRHVVESADHIQVTFPAGKKYDAKLVGQDARTDVALLKIEPREPLTVVPLGNSDQADVGEWVMAIGNPFGLGGNSVTVGVVSYKGRPLDLSRHSTPIDMIQTDASINPGNSGGPLLNTNGEAVGINTLIMTQGVAQSSGVGFAVPINVAKQILPQLRATGKVVRGWLGVQVQGVDEDLAKSLKLHDPKGALVSDTTAGSPAARAGLKPGDVVVGLNSEPIETSSDLSGKVAMLAPGTKVDLQVMRDGAERKVEVTLGTFPDQAVSAEGEASTEGPIGMSLRPVTPDFAATVDLPSGTKGLFVAEVLTGSKAEAAGLRQGDVIVSVDGQDVATVDAFKAAIHATQTGSIHRLRVRRANGYLFLALSAK